MGELPKKLFKPFGSLQMAVSLIFILAIVLSAGTLFESYYSREYAYSLVYGTLWFRLFLLLLGVNILVAALLRLPPKKHLAGFYISHIGLLLILGGSLLTLKFGIDGELTLPPMRFNRTVRLPDPVLYAQAGEHEAVQIPLPQGVFAEDIEERVHHDLEDTFSLEVLRFLPYAKEKVIYSNAANETPVAGSGLQFSLVAPQAGSLGTLSSPPSHYSNRSQLGPLNIFFLGKIPADCILPVTIPDRPWFFVNTEACWFLPKVPTGGLSLSDGFRLRPLPLGQETQIFTLEKDGGSILFLPSVSAWPLVNRRTPGFAPSPRPDYSYALQFYPTADIFSGNVLLLTVENQELVATTYADGVRKTQEALRNFPPEGLTLPWMKLRFAVSQFSANQLPYRTFVPTSPNPGDKDRVSALAVKVNGFVHWLKSGDEILRLPVAEKTSLELFLGYRTFELPWSFRLERFKMDTDPGTQNPASYESFVNLRDEKFQNLENAHIYMNNPLKKSVSALKTYTFFQASYFPVEEGAYGSVLQVNFDPGRAVKYAGSLVLVLGTALHFYIRRTRRAK